MDSASFSLPLAVCDPLVRLRRGDDEAILVPGDTGGPVHLRRGAKHVDALLAAAAAAPSLGALLDERPADAELLRLLMERGVLRTRGPVPSRSCDAGCACGEQRSSGACLYLLLSQRCNCACTYCLAGERTYGCSDKPDQMSDEVARAAIERELARLAPGGRLEVVFFGGEPLLNWDLARRLLDWIEGDLQPRFPDRSVHPHLTSNLVLFPDDLIERAKRHGMSFLVDVDGPPDLHDAQRPLRGGGPSHARIARHIARLREAGLGVALRATITAASVDRMVEIARHHLELGGSGTAFVPVNPIDSDERILPAATLPDPARFARGLCEVLDSGLWKPEQIHPFNEYLGRVRAGGRTPIACGAPYGNTPVVDSAGEIFPCIYWVGIPRLRLGNVRDPDAGAATAVLAGLKAQLHVDSIERCRSCELRYLCGGGCPVQRITLAQHPHPTPEALEYADAIACAVSSTVLERLFWLEADARRRGPDPA